MQLYFRHLKRRIKLNFKVIAEEKCAVQCIFQVFKKQFLV